MDFIFKFIAYLTHSILDLLPRPISTSRYRDIARSDSSDMKGVIHAVCFLNTARTRYTRTIDRCNIMLRAVLLNCSDKREILCVYFCVYGVHKR